MRLSTTDRTRITNCSRVIQHAWHFYYALVLVIKAVCGSIGVACFTP
ncbi:TPA: DUF3265 domain-containing protein [Vibrio parahaemolyticus]|uniref:DUF3265 domain-containing protein n=1 Tax=Vibrio parahaemolyticus TaxID=670 RepID=A0A7Z2MVV4_VIBPH|nr:DUF3265 domain-containing protein [Vibrio parahaemolyticus]HAS6674625.1 DUF3265 domain-containing protein [Vibrio parahaemolyticus]HAS6680315.1 DUF3265 domain-containing protein [Vibrio parahaemolyticus]HAV1495354.1 DUF3265 domain-containing protein [Vibrio parahaemolyticus]